MRHGWQISRESLMFAGDRDGLPCRDRGIGCSDRPVTVIETLETLMRCGFPVSVRSEGNGY